MSPIKLLKEWVFSPPTKTDNMAPKDKDKAKGGKETNSRRNLNFEIIEEGQTIDQILDNSQVETEDVYIEENKDKNTELHSEVAEVGKNENEVIQLEEKDIRPGDKRLASSPDYPMQTKRSTKQGKIDIQNAISPEKLNITSAIDEDTSLTPSEAALTQKLDIDMSVSDLEETHIVPHTTESEQITNNTSIPVSEQQPVSSTNTERTTMVDIITFSPNVNTPITSTPTSATTTVTYSGSTTVMSTSTNTKPAPSNPLGPKGSKAVLANIFKPKVISTPLLTEFFKKKGNVAFSFTPAPGASDIATRLQNIAKTSKVRIKPHHTAPMDENSRRAPFRTPKRQITFGQNPYTHNPFSQTGATNNPELFGFSPGHDDKTSSFEDKMVKALNNKTVVGAMKTVIDGRFTSLMDNIQKQLIILNARLDKKEGKKTFTEARIPDPRTATTATTYSTRPQDLDQITPDMLANDRVDQNTRRNNIKIAGLVESFRDRTFRVVMGLFKDMDVDIRDDDILRCYRLGKKSTTRTRPILVIFTSMYTRNVVMKNRFKLYESNRNLAHVHINEDLTPARSTLIYICRISERFRSVWTYDGEAYVRPWSYDKSAKGDRLYCEADIAKYPQIHARYPTSDENEESEDDQDDQDQNQNRDLNQDQATRSIEI